MLLFSASWTVILAPGMRTRFALSSFHADIAYEIMQLPVSRHEVTIMLDGLTPSLASTRFGRPTIWLDLHSSSKLRALMVTAWHGLYCCRKEPEGHLVNQGTEHDESGHVEVCT